MASKFNYELSQFHFYHSGKIPDKSISLGVFLKDLFTGSKGLIKYNTIYVDESNLPLVDTSAKNITDSVKDKLRLFFPAEFIDYSKPDSVFRALTAHTGPNYSLGNKIINTFNASPHEILRKFDTSCRQFLSDPLLHVDREGLSSYFGEIHSFITPPELSPSSHLKFGELLDNNKLAVILSRILLSMIFAFKPDSIGERSYSPAPEVLNRIWCTPTVNVQTSTVHINNVYEQCSYALGLFESGDYKNSFILLSKLISSKFFTALQPSKIKWSVECAYARQLLSGQSGQKNIPAAISFLSALGDNPDAKHLLSEYYNGVFSEELDTQKAAEYLKEAADEGSAEAILELFAQHVDDFIKGKSDSPQKAEERKNQLLSRESELKSAEKRKFYYAFGLLLDAKGASAEAAVQFERAAALGHEGALRKTARIKRDVPTRAVKFSDSGSKKLCIINGNGHCVGAFIRALPSDFEVISVRDTEYTKRGVKTCDGIWGLVEALGENGLEELEQYEKVTAAFLSDDEDGNIDDTLELLDHLYNASLDLLNKEQAESVCALTEKIDIFLAADYESAAMLVDASINDMRENVYFRVHICDETRDAAHDLLHRFPLFIPFLNRTGYSKKGESVSNAIIFGNTALTTRIAHEACAIAYMGENYPVSISVVGENISASQNRFFRDAPGLLNIKASRKLRCITPQFYECDLNSPDFCKALSANGNRENELSSALASANYFVVDLGDDCENIRFAINLRRWLVKSAPNFDRKPFIAVYCRDAKTARLINTIPLQNQKQGTLWYNRFDICCFGMTASLYSYNKLTQDDTLEKQALCLHKSYYGNAESAIYDYYSSQYNRDSSKITAISLRYRLFVAGCYSDYESAHSFSYEKDAALADRYEAWLNDKRSANREIAAAMEQSRWNGFMLSRGWEPASPEQVRNYIEQASGGQHKNMLAKLHPYICEWEDLMLTEQEIILNILKRKKSDIKNPQKTTEENIAITAKLLREI